MVELTLPKRPAGTNIIEPPRPERPPRTSAKRNVDVPQTPRQIAARQPKPEPLPVVEAPPVVEQEMQAEADFGLPEPVVFEADAMAEAQYGAAVPFTADEDFIDDGLPDDAPGDDRVDKALIERTKDRERQGALEWLLSGAGAVAKDIGGGIAESPSQVLGGARDAAQAALNLIEAGGDAIARGAAFIGYEDEERADEIGAERNMPVLPTIREPTTVTGSLIRGVSQFHAR